MKKILIIFIAIVATYFVLDGSSRDTEAREQVKLIDTEQTQQNEVDEEPFIEEDRSLAAGFQPIMKPYSPRINIPTAHASIIYDVDSGETLYENNADDKRQIASLTKLMTAVIVYERLNLDERVTIDEEAIYAPGTRIGCPRSGYCLPDRLKVGEKLRAGDLLKAALINSANDAAIALGKHIGGSQGGFADIMNRRAKELGMENTNFCTPSGLEPDGREHECFSSARDIARLTAHALRYEKIWQMMREEKQFIFSADGKYQHEIFNTNELLGEFPNLVGTKTGFTPLAGYSLLAVAEDNSRNHRVVAVVLDDQYRWQSIRSMFDWSFQAFEWR